MRKLKLFILVKMLFLTIMFSSAAVSEVTRANDLILDFASHGDAHLKLLNVTFTVRRHVETQPGTFESISTQIMEGEKAKITVNVGRKGSAHVAQIFSYWLGSGGTVFGYSPRLLNFAVQGDLAFTTMNLSGQIKKYVYRDFVIAQGHADFGGNNWWAGGPDCRHVRGRGSSAVKNKKFNSMLCGLDWEKRMQFHHPFARSNHLQVIHGNLGYCDSNCDRSFRWPGWRRRHKYHY